jgi:hypothetical protein
MYVIMRRNSTADMSGHKTNSDGGKQCDYVCFIGES